MPFRPLISVPSRPAMLRGVVALVVCFVAFGIAIPSLLHLNEPHGNFRFWVLILLFIYLVPGFVVGYFAKHSPLMHGALLGIIGVVFPLALVAIVIFVTSPWVAAPRGGLLGTEPWNVILPSLIIAVLLCSLGAIVGDYVAGLRKTP